MEDARERRAKGKREEGEGGLGARFSKIGIFCQIIEIFAIFWRARSRLYQNEILQVKMRLTAFVKFYKMCTQDCTALTSKF